MDKYEYNLKLDQIKAFLENGNYKEAEGLADTISWNKIRNINTLVNLGEVYEKAGRYEESREILLNAYDRSPIGRNILYRLTEVAIKMKDFDGAMEYYEEFVEIAPHDAQKYILKYELMKAKEAAITELIPILEEFKEQEYTEEWAYELAYLYHKAGMIEKCVDACDELILWFGDGPYVESAMELKMLYQPLTKAQEDKYRLFRHEKEGKTIMEVESSSFQDDILSSLPDKYYEAEIINVIDDLDAQIKEAQKSFDEWKKGDEEEIWKDDGSILKEGDEEKYTEEELKIAKEFDEKLLYSRNLAMTDKFEEFFNNNYDMFFTVGQDHVVGDRGIVSYLRQRGYTVTKLS